MSHSAELAKGVVALAREMAGEEVPIEPAGGLAEPEGALGTDAVLVKAAIDAARADGGVLVLMDLGSALMSAEMAVELVEAEDGGQVRLSEAPLVEGAVAAAVAARAGAALDEVASEARGALQAKRAQLGVEEAHDEPERGAAEVQGLEVRMPVRNKLGLHARPAARFVTTASRFDAAISVFNESTGRGPASARSLTAVGALGARQGHELRLRAAGPQAEEALAALGALAEAGFGDADGEVAPAAPEEAAGPVSAEPTAAPAAGAVLTGLAASPGIAVGAARRLIPRAIAVPEHTVDDPDAEWARLERARDAARQDIERARAGVADAAGEQAAAIFDAHLLLLNDDDLVEAARRGVYDEHRNAAKAWHDASERAAEAWGALEDAYMRERAADVRDVAARVVAQLVGGGEPAITLDGPGIVVASDLAPGQTAALDRSLVKGVVTAHGTATSHAAILARGLGIPAVVGVGEAVLAVEPDTIVLLDGGAGSVQIDPPEDVVAEAETRREAAAAEAREARVRAAAPALTRDGRRIEVAANIGAVADAVEAIEFGADGVGLLRTEFLFLGRDRLPDEEEQLAIYCEIAATLDGRPLVVRTLDVGADKPLPALPQEPEANPFLGRRGLRLGLAEPELLRVQLRALLRAARDYPIKVMFPMVTVPAEFRAARAIAEDTRADLGIAARCELGIMVEVPAVALSADIFAREVDFFSIGTNDLTQYTMAAERGNEHVAQLADGPVPQVLQLVAAVTRAAAAHGPWVGVCGEMAGDPIAAALFVGLGVTELSMAPARVPEIKDAIRGLEVDEARDLAERALTLESGDAVRALVGGASRPGSEPVREAAES